MESQNQVQKSRRLSILHLIGSTAVGGAEWILASLVQKQIKAGWKPVIATRQDTDVYRFYESFGFEMIPWNFRSRRSWLTYWRLRKVIRSDSWDLIHAHQAKMSAIAGTLKSRDQLRIPILGMAHNLVKSDHFNRCDYVICVSDAVRKTLLANGYQETHCRTIHNAIDLDRFQPAATEESKKKIRSEFGIEPDAIVMAQHARMETVKGHHVVLSALEKVAESLKDVPWYVLWIGDGTLRDGLEERVRKLGLQERVIFSGFRADSEKLLPAADIFLMPSEKEGLPLALMEAMACGLAPVATPVGGIPEILEHEKQGLLLKSLDPEELGQAMVRLLTSQEERQRYCEASAIKARESFGFDKMNSAINEVYSLLGAGC